MGQPAPTEPITIRATKDVVSEIDALRQYLGPNAWQIEHIKQGIAAARAGRARPAEDVLSDIATKHGWRR